LICDAQDHGFSEVLHAEEETDIQNAGILDITTHIFEVDVVGVVANNRVRSYSLAVWRRFI